VSYMQPPEWASQDPTSRSGPAIASMISPSAVGPTSMRLEKTLLIANCDEENMKPTNFHSLKRCQLDYG
jgi:hypothetical protein